MEETKRMTNCITYLLIEKILAQEDTDGDSQITVHDGGPKSFILGTADSGGYQKFEIRGHYMLSNLLQELALASEHNRRYIILHENRLNENPVDRMTRLIKFHFWDALVRLFSENLILSRHAVSMLKVINHSPLYLRDRARAHL